MSETNFWAASERRRFLDVHRQQRVSVGRHNGIQPHILAFKADALQIVVSNLVWDLSDALSIQSENDGEDGHQWIIVVEHE